MCTTERDGGRGCRAQAALAYGYRYRLNSKSLPGRPDIVLPAVKKAIFVHGCFWHGHVCKQGRLPKSSLEYWKAKIGENRLRDKAKERKLKKLGYRVLTVWQCELRDREKLSRKLGQFCQE